MSTRRSLAAFVGIGLIVLAGVLAWLVWSGTIGSASQDRNSGNAVAQGDVSSLGVSPRKGGRTDEPESAGPADPAANNTAIDQADSSDLGAGEAIDSDCDIAILFVDGSGSPIPEFNVQWATVDRQLKSYLNRETGLELPEFGPSVAADKRGRLLVRVRRLSFLIIRCASENYAHIGPMARPVDARLDHMLYDCVQSPAGTQTTLEYTSRWGSVARAQILVRYDDGAEFTERVEWLAYDAKGRTDLNQPTRGAEEICPNPLLLAGPIGMGYRVTAYSSRSGFKAQTTWDVELTETLVAQPSIELTIARESMLPAPSVIEVDCSGLPADADRRKLELGVYEEAYGSMLDRIEIPEDLVARSRPLTGVREAVYVQLTGAYVWRSGPIVMKPGEVTRVQALPTTGGSIMAKIVDEEAMPIRGAVLFISLPGQRYPWFMSGKAGTSIDGQRAYSNDQGVATITGAPVGTWVVRLEAQGYDHVSATATVAVSHVADLGTLRLSKATGGATILLTVQDGEDPRDFSGSLSLPGGGAYTRTLVFDADGRLEFEALPSGRYNVFVKKGASRGGWSKNFDVDNRMVSVNVDTTLPKGGQK